MLYWLLLQLQIKGQSVWEIARITVSAQQARWLSHQRSETAEEKTHFPPAYAMTGCVHASGLVVSPNSGHFNKSFLNCTWSFRQVIGQIHSPVTVKFQLKESARYKNKDKKGDKHKKCYAINNRSWPAIGHKSEKVEPNNPVAYCWRENCKSFPFILVLTGLVISVTKTSQH